MAERPDDSVEPGEDPSGDEAVAALRADVEAYRADIEAYRADVEERTVHRDAVESDLRQYVRSQLRRGHARGWGPYLVLLYGTAMTLGAFYFLSGGWAILAMVVVWLSTLGLYVVMVITGAVLGALSVPGRVTEALRSRRPGK